MSTKTGKMVGNLCHKQDDKSGRGTWVQKTEISGSFYGVYGMATSTEPEKVDLAAWRWGYYWAGISDQISQF